jgi:hypothetical protein
MTGWRRHVDLESDAAAQALACGDASRGRGFGHYRPPPRHCEARSAEAIQTASAGTVWIASLAMTDRSSLRASQ